MPLIDRLVDVLVMMQRHVSNDQESSQGIPNSTQVQLLGFDSAILIPYWNVTELSGVRVGVKPNSSGDPVARLLVRSFEKPRRTSDVFPRRDDAMPSVRQGEQKTSPTSSKSRSAARPHQTVETASTMCITS